MMKFFPAIIVIGICGFSLLVNADVMAEIKKILHDTCVRKIGVDEKLIEQTRTGVFAEDEKLKCYMKCVFFQIGVMSKDGIVNKPAFIAAIPKDGKNNHGPDMINKCINSGGENPCDRAFQLNKCFYAYSPEKYQIV